MGNIRLLQLSTPDLIREIQDNLENNPMLELKEDAEDNAEASEKANNDTKDVMQ